MVHQHANQNNKQRTHIMKSYTQLINEATNDEQFDKFVVTEQWLREKYAYLNETYFDMRAPRTMMFGFDASTHHLARAEFSCRVSHNSVEVYDLNIKFSRHFQAPEIVSLGVLAHEMIHIIDYVENVESHFYRCHPTFANRLMKIKNYDAHGSAFFEPMAEKLSRRGFPVPVLRHATREDVLNSTSGRRVIFVALFEPRFVSGQGLLNPKIEDDCKMYKFKTQRSALDVINNKLKAFFDDKNAIQVIAYDCIERGELMTLRYSTPRTSWVYKTTYDEYTSIASSCDGRRVALGDVDKRFDAFARETKSSSKNESRFVSKIKSIVDAFTSFVTRLFDVQRKADERGVVVIDASDDNVTCACA